MPWLFMLFLKVLKKILTSNLTYIYHKLNQTRPILKYAGYILFLICCLSFLGIAVIPWLGYSKGRVAGLITVLFITGEISFYLSIFMLGKTFYEKIKSKFKFGKRNPEEPVLPDNPDYKNSAFEKEPGSSK